ncbi:MAG: phosphotransferase family protein [Jiangellaceae bacterium]
MADDIRAVLARHLPGRSVGTLTRLGEGQDNIAWEVDDELIIRRSKQSDPAARADATRREAELLGAVAELSSLPVPELVFADVDAGVLAYRKLPGRPLLERPVAEPVRLAAPLGEFAGGLHRAPVEVMSRLVPRDAEPMTAWRADADLEFRQVAEHLPRPARRLVEAFLGADLPAAPATLAFCHNDLGCEHILVDVDGTITGIIDWTDAAVADPAYDLALVYRDLGPEVFDLTLHHYEGAWDDDARQRAVFYSRCALLEDIAYGVRTGDHRYSDAGLANLDRTFG